MKEGKTGHHHPLNNRRRKRTDRQVTMIREKCGRIPYIIADEPYRNIVYNGVEVAPIFPVYENSIVVSSFAKDLSLPGERLGYYAR